MIADAVERAMDDAGFETAHLVGNSLGGFVALQLAARGRARAWWPSRPPAAGRRATRRCREVLAAPGAMHEQAKAAAPHAEAIVATAEGRRRATQLHRRRASSTSRAELLAHQISRRRGCSAARPMIEHALREGYGSSTPSGIACPVRIVWGTDDRLLPWPSAAARYRHEWLPHADWVELDGVGHCPQLDVPLEAAQLILGFTAA